MRLDERLRVRLMLWETCVTVETRKCESRVRCGCSQEGIATYMIRASSRVFAAACLCAAVFGSPPVIGQESAPDAAEEAPAEDSVDYKALESPVPYTASSIKRGKTTYARYCTECHGPDGKAQIDVIADATDLTTPQFWKHGIAPGEIFRSIRKGAGVAMPPFAIQMRREEDTWHVVNFVRSLWPPAKRPELQDETEAPKAEEEAKVTPEKQGGDTP